MNGSIPIPHPLHEPLWAVGPSTRKETITCPECLGTRTLTVTQGNGAQFEVACACCTVGFGPAQGIIEQTIMERRPVRFTPRRVDVRGNEITYSDAEPGANCYRTMDAENMFTDAAACAARCAELDEKDRAWREEQSINHLKSKRRDLAWSVHYWQGEVRRLEEQLDRVRARLGLCKAREAKKAAKEAAA